MQQFEIGELVFCSYFKNPYVWKIKKIKSKILEERDLKYGAFQKGNYYTGQLVQYSATLECLYSLEYGRELMFGDRPAIFTYISKINIEKLSKYIQSLQQCVQEVCVFTQSKQDISDIISTSPIYCEHANECPYVCPCPEKCYCKFNSCKGR